MNTHEEFREDVTLYALGSLAGEEREKIEQHLAECLGCRRELQALREDMGILALSATGPKPPGRSRERLVAALNDSNRRSPNRRGYGRGWMWFPWFAALACALFASLGYFANLKLKGDIASLQEYARSQTAQLAQANETLELLQSRDAVHVSLTSGPAPARPQGKAIYSPRRGRVIFMASNLPQLPPGKAYELWLVPKKGRPMPAGMFKPDAHGNVMMMDHEMESGIEAQAFAVSVEDETGSVKPTMPLVIVGSAG